MDRFPKVTVIIPTRARLSTLKYALKTCLSIQADNYEVIISDNYSQDDTFEYVESLRDPRIRYINTGKRLSMSHNWEFALSHVTEGFVTYIGDDDGLLPDTIDRVRACIETYQLPAVNSKAINYCWPTHIDPALKNLLTIPLRKGTTVVQSSEILADVVAGRRSYHDLPWLYGGFVDVAVLNQVKARSGGVFFRSQIPDVYSGMALCEVIPTYAYSHEPLIVNGISGHSTGSAQFNPDKNQQAQTTFANEGNIPFHDKFVFGPSIQVLIAECWQQAHDRGLVTNGPDLRATLRQAAKESRSESGFHQQKVKETLQEIAALNEIEPGYVDVLFSTPSAGSAMTKKLSLLRKYLSQKIAMADASRWQISTVDEAATFCHSLLKRNNGWGFTISNLAMFALSRIKKNG